MEQAGPDGSEDIAPPGEAELAELPAQPPAEASPAAADARVEGEDGEASAPRKRGEMPVIDDRTEEQKLTDKIAWFKEKNNGLVDKLAGLQQQHGELKLAVGRKQMQEQQMAQDAKNREQQMRREHQMRQEAQMREQQMMREQQQAAAALPPHNPDWTEQEHEGATYYWNSRTGDILLELEE